MAETAITSKEAAAVVTQDMTSFFQAINLKCLEQRAEKHGFPKCLVRLAIAQYTDPRWLYTDEGVAQPIKPNRGIGPGCSMATTLVKVYYLSALDDFVSKCDHTIRGAIDFNAYIDDFQIAMRGAKELAHHSWPS